MEDMKNYQEWIKWENKFYSLVNILLEKKTLLMQYATLLKSSEETQSKGEDIYYKLERILQGFSNNDFIPGIESRNFVAVVGKVQRELGLDLGVCRYLKDNVMELERSKYTGIPLKNKFSECERKKDLIIPSSSLKLCLPPERIDCMYRTTD